MPGPVSDSYDPEWGTSDNTEMISHSLGKVYAKISRILGGKPPIYILELCRAEDMRGVISATLTEKEWRLIRFAIERARESL
jgi:hypothetical protein